jgi:hypothetical protein
MNTQQQIQIDSPFKQLSKTLDDPTQQEAIAWRNLTRVEKCVLIRGAMISENASNRTWYELVSSHRMAIRSALEKMSRAADAFGGLNA